MTVPWNDDDVRREMKNREGALADGMTTMAARGEGIVRQSQNVEPPGQLAARCSRYIRWANSAAGLPAKARASA